MTRPDTYKQIADYFDGLATLFQQLAVESASAPVSAAGPAAATPAAAPASFDSADFDQPEEWQEFSPAPLPKAAEPTGDQGSEAVCPKHRREYKEGRYGPFCTSTSDDPAWSNKKGYCAITPKNADQWLRMQAAA